MDTALTRRLLAAAALCAAVLAGAQLASGGMALASGLAAAAVLGVAWRLTGLTADVLLAGAALLGYLVGNRGFAQLHVTLGGLPLPVAELTLALGTAAGLWRGARNGTLPVRRDALNALILLWIALGVARLPFDVRAHGFVALRDFALVYYAVFFFLAQAWGAEARARRWLTGCLLAGFALAAPAFAAFRWQPDFFLDRLTVGGTPLIFIKSDVAGGLMAAGALWLALRGGSGRKIGWCIAAAGALAGAVLCNSRAALVALAVGLGWAAVLRQWRLLRTLGALGAAGLLALVTQAALPGRPWADSTIYRLYESAASIADVGGTGRYVSAELADKPDNNRFRNVWWQTVIADTTRTAPWLGQGFGVDVTEPFLRVYQPDTDEEATMRSPHSFPITVYARMGVAGLLALLGVLGVMAVRTWRSAQIRPAAGNGSEEKEAGATDGGADETAQWLGGWAIFTSACFGVVLEGPMGAVVFWTLLGLANAARSPAVTERGR